MEPPGARTRLEAAAVRPPPAPAIETALPAQHLESRILANVGDERLAGREEGGWRVVFYAPTSFVTNVASLSAGLPAAWKWSCSTTPWTGILTRCAAGGSSGGGKAARAFEPY
jgi:hypothetical protein